VDRIAHLTSIVTREFASISRVALKSMEQLRLMLHANVEILCVTSVSTVSSARRNYPCVLTSKFVKEMTEGLCHLPRLTDVPASFTEEHSCVIAELIVIPMDVAL